MSGYRESFLGVPFPQPTFSPALAGDILNKTELTNGVLADYVHYTIVTNREKRSPIYAALNIEQTKLKHIDRADKWMIDTRIGPEFQLNNDYYKSNDWDRGHLARRASAAWGDTQREAQRASEQTFYYSNSALQHKNFNRDEWLALEDWVLEKDNVKDGRIASFSMPHYEGDVRSVTPQGRRPGQVPSGFCKVVGFVEATTNQLAVRAFMILQDREAIKDLRGRSVFNFQTYQITITEVERFTGLEFDTSIFENNPLYAYDRPETGGDRSDRNVNNLPERIEVDVPDEIVDDSTDRVTISDDEIEVYLAGAMVNPSGKETKGEWVSILNLSGKDVDLSGWTLSCISTQSDQSPKPVHGPLVLGTVLKGDRRIVKPGEAVAVNPLGPVRLPNAGGVIILANANGERVDRIRYTKKDAKNENIPVNFFYQDSVSTIRESED